MHLKGVHGVMCFGLCGVYYLHLKGALDVVALD